jgi:hypothetical protein
MFLLVGCFAGMLASHVCICLSLLDLAQGCGASCSKCSPSDHRVTFHTAIGTWRFGTIREDFADFNESLLTNFMSAPVSLFALLFPFESHLLRFLPTFVQRQSSSRSTGGHLKMARPPDGVML